MSRYTPIMEAITLIVFISFLPALFFYEHATSYVWTIIVPLVPLLFLLLGFYNWRKVCPLAFFSKISQKIDLFPKRKVPKWFEQNFYLLQFSFLLIAFSARLVSLNYNTQLLAYFFIFIIFAAFFVNLVYTGKSWCNFFCPVNLVERIYCGSNAHRYFENSACSTCSACKKNCPDIDMENNYWKESLSNQKEVVFYSFSGLVFGFYAYFFLHSGSTEYYFLGEWTHRHIDWMEGGFYFAPSVPVFVAAPLSLLFFSALSYLFFKMLEKLLAKIYPTLEVHTLKHRVKMIAAFCAFNIFYIFAGAPAYAHYPTLYALFYFFVVMLSSFTLYKEFHREENFFVQERFAIRVLKKLKVKDIFSRNLKEIYYTYANSNKNTKERLQAYKESLIDLLESGVLSQDNIEIMEKIRINMGISKSDHQAIYKEITESYHHLLSGGKQLTLEQLRQRKSYTHMIESLLEQNKTLDPNTIAHLQQQFNISEQQHKEIVDAILHTNLHVKKSIMEIVSFMQELILHYNALDEGEHISIHFLKYTIKSRFYTLYKELFNFLNIIEKNSPSHLSNLRGKFKKSAKELLFDFSEKQLAFLDETLSKELLKLNTTHMETSGQKNTLQTLKKLLHVKGVNINDAALLAISALYKEELRTLDIENIIDSSNPDSLELQEKLTQNPAKIILYEKMQYLSNIHIFESVKFNQLHKIASKSKLKKVVEGEEIIRENDIGDALYIILRGEVSVSVGNKHITSLKEGEYFGEVAILADIKRTATIRAMRETKLLYLSAKAFKKLVHDNPKVGLKVMKKMTKRLLEIKN